MPFRHESVVRKVRKTIEQYANGIFDYDAGKLVFSVPKIEASLVPDELYEGTFTVTEVSGREFSANVYTSNMRLVCRVDKFSDVRSAELHFVFDPTGLIGGDVIKGDIQIVSNVGEYYIPFVFSVITSVQSGTVGSIRNLFHFTNQAQVDWAEAVSLFYSPDFLRVFDGNDRIHLDKYLGFSRNPLSGQSVDDFLVAINKKSPITYAVERSHYEFKDVTDEIRCEILLKKSTWGYVSADLSADAPFIRLDRTHLSNDDFLGNSHKLVFFIVDTKLHEGRNFGQIHIKSVTGDVTVSVVARMREHKDNLRIEKREKKSLTLRLMRQYISFRIKKTGINTWVRESMKIVERMNALDDKNPVSRLFQAQLLLVQQRTSEASWILEHVEKEMDIAHSSPECYTYYLYLLALEKKNDAFIDKMASEAGRMYERYQNSFEILWVYMYLDADLSSNSTRKISLIENLCMRGCKSPVMYIEAYNYYVSNPAKLTKLGDFELRILCFVAKEAPIDNEVAKQILYLSSKMREYSPRLYFLLTRMYEIKEDPEIVSAICNLLIHGNRMGTDVFKWYELGVMMQLRITKLYEYYLYSVPLQYTGVLPKSVLMYFSFRNDMDYHRIAFLYANLIAHKHEVEETYMTYREHMQIFAVEQVDAEHVDENLARIYEDVLSLELIRPSMAPHLAKILFAHQVKMPQGASSLVLLCPQLADEEIYPVDNGMSYPYIYFPEYTMFAQFDDGRRVIIPKENAKKLMNEVAFIPAIRFYVSDNAAFSMYLCEGRRHYVSVDETNVENCRELTESPKIREYSKREIRMALLRFYYDNDQISTLDEFLTHLDIRILEPKDRADVVTYYVRRGMFEKAYEVLCVYGVEQVPAKVCVRICNHMINQKDQVPDAMLLKLSHYAFAEGKYDALTLSYLVDNYQGLTKELRNLWRAAREFDVDTHNLMERIIIQMLYTHTTVGEKEEIFEEYLREGATFTVEMAYLSCASYEFFTRDRLTDDRVFDHIIHNYRIGEELNDALRLAILKYYAEEKKEMSPRIREMITEFLMEFLHRNVYFTFFQYYGSLVPELAAYTDKVVIEYRTNPNNRVLLHYILEGGQEDDETYRTEEMRNMFGGVFSREFVLFFGENLQYYITEEENGNQMLTSSDSVSVSDTTASHMDSRYSMINDMVVSHTMQDEDTLISLMEEYAEADAFSHKLFRIR